MQYYEFVGLIPGNFAENEVEPIINEITAEFKKAGGEVKRQDSLGRRRTAYAIKNMRHAYYFLIGVEIAGDILPTIEKKLKLNKNILRFLITKSTVKTAEEIVKEKKRMNRPEEVKDRPRRERPPAPRPQPVAKPAAAEPAKPEKKPEPVDLKQLEEKIDEILEGEIE